ncbi:MAG: hypothetical protein LBR10_03995 [Prevotellaceae bacterium]|nr:hypothetical protein [Prevotellaceae bacterium]
MAGGLRRGNAFGVASRYAERRLDMDMVRTWYGHGMDMVRTWYGPSRSA